MQSFDHPKSVATFPNPCPELFADVPCVRCFPESRRCCRWPCPARAGAIRASFRQSVCDAWKTVIQFRRYAFDLKIAARLVFNLITESHQFARQFVIINILDKFLRGEHFAILQRLPFLFDGIKCCVEHDAMTVQVRV